jgi:hypothetical protein
LPISPGEDDPEFSPDVVVAVKALACELPTMAGAPLARWCCPDLARTGIEQGIVASISGTTIWRWLSADAIKPWQHRSWIVPRDPDFAAKAARVLDLYTGRFDAQPLRSDEYVISADEKTCIQARITKTPHRAAGAGPPRARRTRIPLRRLPGLPGRLGCAPRPSVRPLRAHHRDRPFGRLVAQVMTSQPYASARRVFWIVDNGSSHRGQSSVDRLQSRWPTLRLIHLPTHASSLNQVEI